MGTYLSHIRRDICTSSDENELTEVAPHPVTTPGVPPAVSRPWAGMATAWTASPDRSKGEAS